jgi:hypothetical protein
MDTAVLCVLCGAPFALEPGIYHLDPNRAEFKVSAAVSIRSRARELTYIEKQDTTRCIFKSTLYVILKTDLYTVALRCTARSTSFRFPQSLSDRPV